MASSPTTSSPGRSTTSSEVFVPRRRVFEHRVAVGVVSRATTCSHPCGIASSNPIRSANVTTESHRPLCIDRDRSFLSMNYRTSASSATRCKSFEGQKREAEETVLFLVGKFLSPVLIEEAEKCHARRSSNINPFAGIPLRRSRD